MLWFCRITQSGLSEIAFKISLKASVTGVRPPYSRGESEVQFGVVSQRQMLLNQNNNVLSCLCLQLCFLCLSGHWVLPSMRSYWGYFCSLILKVTHPPSCCNSSPFPTTALAFLAPAFLSSCNLFIFSPLLGPDLCCRNVTCDSSHGSSSIKEGVGMLYLSSWVSLCYSTKESSLLLLLPLWLSAGFPSVKPAFPHCHCCPSRAGSSLCHV